MHILSLDTLPKNQEAFVHAIRAIPKSLNITQEEFEKRLLEMGIDEGTPVTILHEGPVQRDPIAIRVRNCYTIAIRRSEAKAIDVIVSE